MQSLQSLLMAQKKAKFEALGVVERR